LEALWKAWSTHHGRDKYADFKSGLAAGVEKISGYYEKSADSDAYIIAMSKFRCPLHNANVELDLTLNMQCSILVKRQITFVVTGARTCIKMLSLMPKR